MSGWGTLTSGGRQPEELMEVTVTTMTNTQVETVIDALPTKHLLQKHFCIHFIPPVHHGDIIYGGPGVRNDDWSATLNLLLFLFSGGSLYTKGPFTNDVATLNNQR